MSTAEKLILTGQLRSALEVLTAEVRSRPDSAWARAAFVETLLVLGDWARASVQLDVLGELDGSYAPMVATCRSLLEGEAQRRAVIEGARAPVVVGEPPPWIGALIVALRHDAAGEHDAAIAQRRRAFEGARPIAGTVNGKPFTWVADADARFGPALELIADGRYYWVPFERLRALSIAPPAALRDLVWTPVVIEWCTGGQQAGHVPTRYPGTESAPEPALQLARETRWRELNQEHAVGVGQRMLVTDEDLYGLLDIRRLELQTPAS